MLLRRPALLRWARGLWRSLALTLRWAGSAPLLRRGWTLCGPALTTRGRHAQRLVCPTWARARRPTLGHETRLTRLGTRPCQRPATYALGTWSPYAGPHFALGRVRATFAPGLDPVRAGPYYAGPPRSTARLSHLGTSSSVPLLGARLVCPAWARDRVFARPPCTGARAQSVSRSALALLARGSVLGPRRACCAVRWLRLRLQRLLRLCLAICPGCDARVRVSLLHAGRDAGACAVYRQGKGGGVATHCERWR